MKAFIESQFGCCCLAWIFHEYYSRGALCLVYTDDNSAYDQLLGSYSSWKFVRLTIGIYKFKNNVGPEILHIFEASANIYHTRIQF